MDRIKLLAVSVVITCLVGAVLSQSRRPPAAIAFDGATLITGDGSAPIKSGTLVVQDGRITAIGLKGHVAVPPNAERVDVTGKTIMPAMVNTHVHIGYEGFTSWGAENYSPANIADHLRRQAYYGVGAVLSAGSDPTDSANQFQKEQQAGRYPGAARFFSAAGMAPPGGGPDHVLILGTRQLKAVYDVSNAAEARTAVDTAFKKGVTHIKIWIDDRGGTYPKLTPAAYQGIIDEAHKRRMKVIAHATTLADSKAAIRAGVDMLVHIPYTEPLDDEYLGLLKERKPLLVPQLAVIEALRGMRSPVCAPDPFIEETLSAQAVAQIRKESCDSTGKSVPDIRMAEAVKHVGTPPKNPQPPRPFRMEENVPKMLAAGARVVLGTDVGVFNRWSFGWADHVELETYVRLGLSPAEAIVAATQRPAEFMDIKDMGTLASGKSGDFIVLNANPLENIRNTRQIWRVYLRGETVNRDALKAGWRTRSSKKATFN